jgi:hypothetical protein
VWFAGMAAQATVALPRIQGVRALSLWLWLDVTQDAPVDALTGEAAYLVDARYGSPTGYFNQGSVHPATRLSLGCSLVAHPPHKAESRDVSAGRLLTIL